LIALIEISRNNTIIIIPSNNINPVKSHAAGEGIKKWYFLRTLLSLTVSPTAETKRRTLPRT
jgi:hypothetical protein